jgi:ankyrin repeat protein
MACKLRSALVIASRCLLTCSRFRWVSLQIQTLCDWRRIKTEEQINQELGRLPKTLEESYDAIYQTISDSGPENRTLAEKVMKWLICAQRPLYSHELIAAISVDSEGRRLSLSNDVLLDICCNMVVLDSEQNVFRFAHLSVREYLEGRGDYTLFATHSLAFERCLDVLTFELILTPTESTIKQNSIFQEYANLYWPVHCQTVESNHLVEGLRQKLRQFLFQGCNAGHLFTKWVSAASDLSKSLWNDPLKHMLTAASNSPPTPIFLACSFGLVSIMDDLGTFKNIDWNQRNAENSTGLHLASENGHKAVVRLLLEAKADVNVKDSHGETALYRAVRNGHAAVVKLLLEAKADINVKSDFGATVLHWAAGEGHEAIVKLLLEAKANVNVKNNFEATVLHWAAGNGHEAIVKLLLEVKADVNVEDTDGTTVLHWAAGNGHEAVVKLLLEAKADVNVKDNFGATVLHWAAGDGHEAMVKLLLEAKADVNVKDREGETALHWAARNGHEVVVKLLQVGSR